jgi:hypothetical protein
MTVPFQIYEDFGKMDPVHRPTPARPVSKIR